MNDHLLMASEGLLLARLRFAEEQAVRLRQGLEDLQDYLGSGEPFSRLAVWDRVAAILDARPRP